MTARDAREGQGVMGECDLWRVRFDRVWAMAGGRCRLSGWTLVVFGGFRSKKKARRRRRWWKGRRR